MNINHPDNYYPYVACLRAWGYLASIRAFVPMPLPIGRSPTNS